VTYSRTDVTIGMTDQDRPRLAQLSLGDSSAFYGTARRSHRLNIWLLTLPNDLAGAATRVGAGAGRRLFIEQRAEQDCPSGLHAPVVHEAVTQDLAPGSLVWAVGAHFGFVSAIATSADWHASRRGAGS
jgi:hypothetical protein